MIKSGSCPHRITAGLALVVLIHASPAEDRAGKLFLDPVFEKDAIRVTKDIPFATGAVTQPQPGDRPLLLDIYQPPEDPGLPPTLPALVFMYGGGWKKGDKHVGHATPFLFGFAQRGYVTLSIQYRMLQDEPPLEPGPSEGASLMQRTVHAAAQDAANAVRWLRANAGKYNVDPDRIVVGGISAGAINSLLLAYQEAGTLGPGAEVAAVLSHMGAMHGNEGLIDADDPPVFMVHGTEDKLVPYQNVSALEKRLQEAGVDHVLMTVEGQGHGLRFPDYAETLIDGKSIEQRCFEFFFEKLKLAGLQIKKAD